MVTQQMLDFIRAQDAQGKSRLETKNVLISQGGWSLTNIEEAFALIPSPIATPTPVPASMSQPTPAPQFVTSAPSHTAPIAAPGVAPVQATAPAPAKSKRSWKVWAVAAAVVVLVVGGLAASAYAFVPSVKETVMYTFASPEERAYLGLMKFAEVETYAFDFKSETSTEVIEEGTSSRTPFLLEGLVFEGVLTATGVVQQLPAASDGTAQSELFTSFSLEAVIEEEELELEGDVYFSPEEFALRLTGPRVLIIFDLSELLDRWIDFSPESLEDDAEELGIPVEDVSGISTMLQAYNETSAFVAKEIPNFVSIEALEDEEMAGEEAWHYRFVIDKDALYEVLKKSPLLTSDDIDEETRETTAEALEEAFANYLEISGELWVGKDSHYPLKMTMKEREAVDTGSLRNVGTLEQVTTSTLTLSKFNEPVTIEKPRNTLSFMEALELITLDFGLFGEM